MSRHDKHSGGSGHPKEGPDVRKTPEASRDLAVLHALAAMANSLDTSGKGDIHTACDNEDKSSPAYEVLKAAGVETVPFEANANGPNTQAASQAMASQMVRGTAALYGEQ